jgi:hypothetical protein
MLAREPDMFLKALRDAFFDHTKGQSIPTRNALFFYGANFAAIARLMELDRIIPEFKNLSKQARTTERMFEEDRLLYGFFTNALSAIESFCFGAYFLGTALSTSDFEPEPELWRIDPAKTLNCFRKLDSNSSFTKALRTCICSERYATTSAVRNALSHRFTPFRTIRPMVDLHSWNLDLWFEGKLSKKVFSIESKSLIEVRDWSDQQLDLLSKELESLAAHHGPAVGLVPPR